MQVSVFIQTAICMYRRVKFKLIVCVYSAAEGSESEVANLEPLLCEGDIDDGNCEYATENELDSCEENTAKSKPNSVKETMLLEVGLNYLTEGPDSKASKLNELETHRDTDKSAAPNNTEKEADGSYDEAEGEPKNVAECSHEKNSF